MRRNPILEAKDDLARWLLVNWMGIKRGQIIPRWFLWLWRPLITYKATDAGINYDLLWDAYIIEGVVIPAGTLREIKRTHESNKSGRGSLTFTAIATLEEHCGYYRYQGNQDLPELRLTFITHRKAEGQVSEDKEK